MRYPFVSAQCLALAGLALFLTPLGARPASAAPVEVPTHAVTVDDVLATEGIGEALFSPDGAWLAWNLVPPYDRLADYSWWLRAYGLSGHQLWIRNMKTGETGRQPGLDEQATNYLFGMSPGGDHVIVLEHRLGRLRLVACRIAEEECVRFDPMPDIRDKYVSGVRYNERLVWVSPDRFIMPVRDHTRPGSELRSRAAIGHYLGAQWRRAWTGAGPTASVAISTGRDRAQDWAPGKLMEFDIVTGETRLVAKGRYAGLRASPDGHDLLAARTGERIRPPVDARPIASETHPIFDRRYALTLIDRETGHTRRVDTPFNIDPNSLVWAGDGAHFAVYGWDRGMAPEEGSFYVFDRRRLQARRYSHAGLSLAGHRPNPSYLWWGGPARAALLGDRLAVLAHQEDTERLDWYLLGAGEEAARLTGPFGQVSRDLLHADASSVTLMADDAVWRVAADGTHDRLTPRDLDLARPLAYRPNPAHGWTNEFRLSSSMVRYPLSPRLQLVVEKEQGNGETILFLDAADGAVGSQLIATQFEGARVIAASGPAASLVATVRDGAATRLMLFGKDETPTELAQINAHLDRVRPPDTSQVSYTLHDPAGNAPPRQTDACLLLPPGYQADRRYPLLVEVYPTGTGGSCQTLLDRPQPAAVTGDLWAARSFIYVRPAFPLDLVETADGPVAAMGDVFDQTVDALVGQGYADPDRIVLYGFSQGGLLSLVTATQSRKPAAIISMNGWADFFSHYFGARGLMRYFHLDQNGGDNRWRYECDIEGASHYCPFGIGETAIDAPEIFARTSPVANADRISAPVMLVHSDLDYFDMAQYDEMFGALYRSGKEAVYVRYWGEGHGPSSPANIRDLWDRMDAFLEEAGIIAG